MCYEVWEIMTTVNELGSGLKPIIIIESGIGLHILFFFYSHILDLGVYCCGCEGFHSSYHSPASDGTNAQEW